jgi:hypothetical protein
LIVGVGDGGSIRFDGAGAVCKGFVLVLGLCIGVVLAVFDGGPFGRLVLDRGTSGSRVEANLGRWAGRWSGIAPSAIWGHDPSVALG